MTRFSLRIDLIERGERERRDSIDHRLVNAVVALLTFSNFSLLTFYDQKWRSNSHHLCIANYCHTSTSTIDYVNSNLNRCFSKTHLIYIALTCGKKQTVSTNKRMPSKQISAGFFFTLIGIGIFFFFDSKHGFDSTCQILYSLWFHCFPYTIFIDINQSHTWYFIIQTPY